ncbi:MAG: cation:proton antiporter [Deltaproteobacteria bacterium]|nr:cation:proton antiporter [Deltaproteobacteria bacterium]MBI2210402.1 cation:proton antiporter [Deltaproteobacteria bacterium]MBI2347121.1 cation:proton antiporter [Deltaproteobacteria bacterium]MBI2991740.1 cation:proton antiporter [Deltaproteobacteria bacterium]MBI3060583.1 cation:proton antiporter [Deltaproteobacteria bacterium]
MMVTIAVIIALAMLSVALLLALVRLARGPSLPDRVVALDLMGTLAVGMITVYAMTTQQPVFLDVAIVLALISFLGTVAFARYVEKRGS